MIYDSIELPIPAANILLPIIIELLNTQTSGTGKSSTHALIPAQSAHNRTALWNSHVIPSHVIVC